MKTSSDELFLLIRSLDSREKVYFKTHSPVGTRRTDYMRLFEIINAQKGDYDEAKIKSILKDRQLPKNFKHVKNRLLNALLSCLEKYHSQDTVNAVLRKYIQQIEFLNKKRLFVSSKKLLAKSEKLAVESYSYYYWGILLSLKQEVMLAETNVEEISNYSHSDHLNEARYTEILKNIIDYNKLYTQVAGHIGSRFVISDKMRKDLNKLLGHPLLKHESKAISLPSQLKYFTTKGDIYLLLHQWHDSYPHYKKALQLMEKNPSWLKNEVELFLVIINRLSITLSRLGKLGELSAIYQRVMNFIKTLPKKQQSGSVYKIYVAININYFGHLLRRVALKEAVQQGERLAFYLKKYYSHHSFLVFQSYNFLLSFLLNDYHKALHHVNEILNAKKSSVRQDLVNTAKILNLVVHYELGNDQLLPFLCKSSQRYLEKKGEFQKAEKIIVDFFGKTIGKANTLQEKIYAFQILKNELKIAGSLSKISDTFDFINWVESKIQNRPFIDIMRENKI